MSCRPPVVFNFKDGISKDANMSCPYACMLACVCAYLYYYLWFFVGADLNRNDLSGESVRYAVLKDQRKSRQHTLVPDFVQEIDHNVDLIDSSIVEVLPDCQCELFFGDLSLSLPASHGG